ncbi:MAG: hypothetical protein GDA66_12320 [Nitrospira sp. CR1.2]|nr:hypothetical protein [Nitrospira sp. CR1.2]
MSEMAPETSAVGAGPITVLVDASFEPLIPKFMANRNREVTVMTEAVSRHDFDTIKQVAHGMKGVSGSYGFHAMTTIAAELEQAAKTAAEATIRTHLATLASYLARVEITYE